VLNPGLVKYLSGKVCTSHLMSQRSNGGDRYAAECRSVPFSFLRRRVVRFRCSASEYNAAVVEPILPARTSDKDRTKARERLLYVGGSEPQSR
jgi:hypothetical protein